MANPNAPFGLRPVRTISGGDWAGKVVMCYHVDATPLGLGDPVVLAGSGGNAIPGDKIKPDVTRATAGAALFGVVVGVAPEKYDSLKYAQASVGRDVMICPCAPDVVFQIQEDSDTNAIELSEIGMNIDLATVGALNTTTGLSTVVLDSTDANAGAGQFKLLGPADIVRNGTKNGLGDYCVWEVITVLNYFSTGVNGV